MANETFNVTQTTLLEPGNDTDLDSVIDPGEVVTTTVTITNNSTTPTPVTATGVEFMEILAGMTIVDQPGALDNINVSPIAFHDNYNVIGNTTFTVSAADGVLGGATAIHITLSADAEFFGHTIGANTATQTHIVTTGVIDTGGGSVTLNADGSFTYMPDAGFTGTDSFTYTLTDAGLDGSFGTLGDNLTGTATVTFNVQGTVWFIDNTAPGSLNLGTQANPFTTIAAFNLVNDGTPGAADPDVNDFIYLREGTYSAADGINLLNGQVLVGQGETLSVTHSVQGSMTVETGAAGQTPVIQVTGAGNQGIQLAQNNTISGLDVGMNNAGAIGIADGGGSVGTLNITNVGVGVGSSSGQAIDIDQGGNLNVTLEVLNSTGSAGQGVQLAGTASSGIGLISGSFTATTGAISGSTGTGFLIGAGAANTGGTIAVSQSGSVTTAVGVAVEVYDRISGAGTITFSGDVDHTAGTTSGILLSNIAAGAINFSGAGTRTLNVTGGGHGVSVSGMSGTSSLTFSNGALDIDATNGHGFSVGGMTGTSSINVQVAADIDTTGIDPNGRGIHLTNTGGSVNFTGGNLTVSTVGGIGISYDNASQGSSLTISGAGNTVTTATGPILVMTNGALGVGGATFASLTSTGVTTGTAININNLDSNSFSGGTVSIAGSAANGISIGNISSTAFTFGSTTIGTGANTVAQNGILLDTGNGSVTISSVDIDNVTGIGVSIQNATSAVTISGGTIGATNDPAGIAVDIGGGAAAVTIDASINKTSAGDVVEVTGRTGGIVDFNGNVTSTAGGGIDINTNSGGTVRFDGGMTLSTGAVTAFNATGNTGMTLVVTDPGGPNSGNNNVLTTTTATALNVANTTIGGEDLNFRSVTSNGATNGIVLNTTGATGGLNITGDGLGGAHSGGTIQNAGGDGIVLTNVSDVNLTNIRVLSVVGHSINANNLGGVNTITNSTIQFWDTNNTATKNGLNLVNLNTSMTSMVITGSTFDGVAGTPAAGGPNDGVYMEAQGNSSMNLRIEDSLFTRIFGDGIQLSSITGSTGTVQARIWDNDFTNAVPQSAPNTGGGNGGISLTPFGGVTFRADVDLNTFTNIMNSIANLGAIGGTSGLTANTNVTVTDNVINGLLGSRGISFTADGSGTFKLLLDNNSLDNLGSNHAGISVNLLDTVVGDVTITNNDVGQNGTIPGRLWTSGATLNNGILLLTQDSAVMRALVSNNLVTANTGSVFEVVRTRAINSSTLNAIVTNNTITDSDSTHVEFDATAANTATINLDISGNLLAGGGAVGVIKLNEVGATSVLNVEQASQAAVSTANNNATVTPGGTPQYNTGNPPTPTLPTLPTAPLMAQPPADEAAPGGSGGTKGDGTGGAFIPPAPDLTPDPVTGDPVEPAADPEPEPGPAPAPGGGAPGVFVEDGVLSQAELNFLVDAAIARWTATGLDPEQVAALESLTFTVADMEALYLGSYRPGLITLDNDGAGYGWFLDYTPLDDSEFVRDAGTRFTAAPSSAPAGDFDLLTTLLHEMGHALGLHDMYDAASRDNLMYGYLFTGERRLPGEGLADGAVAGSITSEEFAGSPIIVNSGNSTTGAFTLPAGYTVTIQWQATIDAQTNQLIVNPSNQGNVSATNPPTAFPDKLTDDPAVGGANDPNVTVLDTLTLGGTVWLDTGAGGGIAKNGTKEAGETTVDNVLVTLFADTGSVAGSWDATDTQIGSSIQTAGGGNYSFTGLAPGEYIVRIDQDNFDSGGNVSLLDKLSTTGGSTDPDNNIDNDDNGVDLAGGPVYSQALTLAYNSEPDGTPGGAGDTDGDADDDTNFTLDFGFVAPNQPPQQTNLQGDTATWTEGDGAVLLDDSSAPELAATITDPDSADFDGGSLIVTISVGAFPSEEGLFIQSIGNITSNPLTASSGTVSFMNTEFATYAGGGFAGGNITFTFDVDATPAAVQALVRAMSYNNNGGDNPTAGTRLVSWTLNDGDGNANGGNPLLLMSSSINVAATNDNPVIADLGGDSVTYVEEAPAILLDDSSAPEVAATVTDPDSADFNGGSVTVSITANEVGAEDVLGISTAGTVTLSSGTSVGSIVSVGGSAIGTITANGAGGNDLVIALNTVDATPGRVTILVQALTYANTNTTSPSTLARTVAVTVADGDGGSDSETVTVTVTDAPENAAPVVDLDLTDLGSNDDTNLYVENSPSSGIGTDIAVTDTEGDNVVSATITITDPETGDLLFANLPLPGGITIDTVNSTDTTMILIGSASAATYATALGQVGFTSSSDDPTDGGTNPNRVITVTASDAGGTGPAATMTMTVAGVNDEPTLIATGLDPTFPENTAAVDLYSTVTADTVEGGQTFASMTLTVTNVFDGANEILTFDGSPVALTHGNTVAGTATNGLTVNVTVAGSTATVTFTGATLSEAALQTLVDALAYRNTAIPPTDGDRVITITQLVDSGSNTGDNDNVGAPNIVSTVDVEPNNQAPAVDLDNVAGGVNYTTSYTEGAPGVAIGSGVTVTDPNFGSGDMIESATIVLTDRVAGDALTLTGVLPPGVIAVTTPTAGAITIQITGPGTGAQYQALIESIQYSTTSQDPTVGGTDTSRTITVTVNDGTLDSAVATTTVNITPLDDAAVAEPDAYTITESGTIVGGNLFADNGSGADSDPDGPPIAISAVSGGAGANVGTQFTLDSGALLTVNANGTFDYDPNGIFLPTPTAGSGASNTPSQDSFTYTLAGGNEVMVSITLTGLDTNDLLLGTPGADTLAGGGGNDTYVVDNLDSIIETAGQGFDQVYALVSYTLAAAVSAEVLAPTTSGSTTAINLFGNALGQQIFGNAGANILGGGGGTDSLYGLGGDDIYSVEQDDFVFEGAGQGFDQVYVLADYALAAGIEAEVLAVGDASSLGSIYLTGNAFGQQIFGNDGANVIDGGGGADALYGRGGDDIYSVQSDDLVFEDAGDGFDQVYTSGSFTLAAGAEVEVLATANSAALTALSLTGNEFGQQVIGNAGANVLDGGGGADSLFGNGGADNYAFTAALGGGNVDIIFDYSGIGTDGDDIILLDDAVFTGLAPGALDPNAFAVGSAADADDRIIYDVNTGGLYFDADGNGVGAAILFAILDGTPAITAGDFIVI